MTNQIKHNPHSSQESRLLTLRKAAVCIGIEYRQLLTAANEGKIPIYRLGKSHRLVNVQEVISLMRSFQD